MTTTEVRQAGRREWIGLSVLALACLLYVMDLTVLHLAVPSISEELKPSSAQLLWIIDIYGFMVAGFLITMGTLGDRIGRRKLLLIGAAAFGVLSLLAAFSTSAEMLIVLTAASFRAQLPAGPIETRWLIRPSRPTARLIRRSSCAVRSFSSTMSLKASATAPAMPASPSGRRTRRSPFRSARSALRMAAPSSPSGCSAAVSVWVTRCKLRIVRTFYRPCRVRRM